MNPHTGEIRSFKTPEEAAAAGFTRAISDAQAKRLLPLERDVRLAMMGERARARHHNQDAYDARRLERERAQMAELNRLAGASA